MDLELEDKAALLVASSTGIGFAVAEELAREGARLLLTGRTGERLEAARARLAATGARVEVFAGDVARAADCRAMVAACQAAFGRVDLLFCNAGGPPAGGPLDVRDEDVEHALALNLLSVVHLCRAAVPIMQAQRFGRIVALASISIKQPIDGLALSNTARAGAQGFLKSLASEVGRHGITVNTVCPGYTATDRLVHLAQVTAARQGTTVEDVYASWSGATPVGRLGRPEEIAAVVAFLASARAAFVHGAVIPVDGGAVRSLL